MVVLVGTITSFGLSASDLAYSERVHGVLESRSQRVVEKIVTDLRSSSRDLLIPAYPQGYELRFQFAQILGLDPEDGAELATLPVQYEVRAAMNEIANNGLDDNANGLIDECTLVRTSADGERAVIATGIKGWDEKLGTFRGLRMFRATNTDRIRIALTLQTLDRNQRLIEKTHLTSITLRQ